MTFSLTLLLVAFTGITSYQAFQSPTLRSKMLFIPTRVKTYGEHYRFLSHALIHADWGHLLVNLFVLYQFGEIVELNFLAYFGEVTGRLLYLALYFGGAVLSPVYSYWKHQDDYSYSALGASGAVSSIVFTFIFFAPWSILLLFFVIPMPAIVGGALYLWYSSYMGKRGTDNIGHDAHFWGAVFGAAFVVVASLLVNPLAVQHFWQQLLAGPDFTGIF